MFSSIFGKRRSSPVEETETPPIPGPRSDDGFVVVNPALPSGGLYPDMSAAGASVPYSSPYPRRPAPPAPLPRTQSTEQPTHYLQGVPFTLSRELKMASNKDSFAIEIGDLLAFATNKMNISTYEYNFRVEKSVLKEC